MNALPALNLGFRRVIPVDAFSLSRAWIPLVGWGAILFSYCAIEKVGLFGTICDSIIEIERSTQV